MPRGEEAGGFTGAPPIAGNGWTASCAAGGDCAESGGCACGVGGCGWAGACTGVGLGLGMGVAVAPRTAGCGAGVCTGVAVASDGDLFGVGGGGMTPFGGPYWRTGREGGSGAGGFGSLTAYMVASKTCGSTVMVTWPSLTMLSLGGLLGSSMTTPFRLTGLDQYFSKMLSLIHLWRDRVRESARTPLCRGRQWTNTRQEKGASGGRGGANLSETD